MPVDVTETAEAAASGLDFLKTNCPPSQEKITELSSGFKRMERDALFLLCVRDAVLTSNRAVFEEIAERAAATFQSEVDAGMLTLPMLEANPLYQAILLIQSRKALIFAIPTAGVDEAASKAAREEVLAKIRKALLDLKRMATGKAEIQIHPEENVLVPVIIESTGEIKYTTTAGAKLMEATGVATTAWDMILSGERPPSGTVVKPPQPTAPPETPATKSLIVSTKVAPKMGGLGIAAAVVAALLFLPRLLGR